MGMVTQGLGGRRRDSKSAEVRLDELRVTKPPLLRLFP